MGAVVVGPSPCHQGSVGPCVSIVGPFDCVSIQAGEHLSQGDNLTPEGTFEALNSTFVPREDHICDFWLFCEQFVQTGSKQKLKPAERFLKEVETPRQLVLGDLITG